MTADKLRRPLLVAALAMLLLGVLTGGSGAEPPRLTTKVVTVPAGAFHATKSLFTYTINGNVLYSESGSATFAAPLYLENRPVTINSITIYAFDNNAGSNVCLSLYRTTPWDGLEQQMGQVCTAGAAAAVRTFNNPSIDPRAIGNAYGPYLWVLLPGADTDGYMFVGARVSYSY